MGMEMTSENITDPDRVRELLKKQAEARARMLVTLQNDTIKECIEDVKGSGNLEMAVAKLQERINEGDKLESAVRQLLIGNAGAVQSSDSGKPS